MALRALVLGILHGPLRRGLPTYLSNQMPRTYATKPASAVKFWAARRMEPPFVDVLDAVRRRARFTLAEPPPPTPGWVWHGDSRELRPRPGTGPIRWIVTSPPYLGMRTYLRISGSGTGSSAGRPTSTTRAPGRSRRASIASPRAWPTSGLASPTSPSPARDSSSASERSRARKWTRPRSSSRRSSARGGGGSFAPSPRPARRPAGSARRSSSVVLRGAQGTRSTSRPCSTADARAGRPAEASRGDPLPDAGGSPPPRRAARRRAQAGGRGPADQAAVDDGRLGRGERRR